MLPKAKTLVRSESDLAPYSDEPVPLPQRLAALSARCLAYAAAARIKHFRYCPRPAPLHRDSLDVAIAKLEAECDGLEQKAVCQSLAFELLAAFASLAHRPPCRSRKEQGTVAKIVHTALLDLR